MKQASTPRSKWMSPVLPRYFHGYFHTRSVNSRLACNSTTVGSCVFACLLVVTTTGAGGPVKDKVIYLIVVTTRLAPTGDQEQVRAPAHHHCQAEHPHRCRRRRHLGSDSRFSLGAIRASAG
eukprot:475680-Prorocentrum_minimum.AAC.5